MGTAGRRVLPRFFRHFSKIFEMSGRYSKFERGFIFDWNTTTFFCYIVGFRQSDFSLVLVQIDAALEKHSDPFYVDIDNIGNVSYDPKAHQLCFGHKNLLTKVKTF